MTSRRHPSFALMLGALLFVSLPTAHAQTEEDPEPEVSDQGPQLSDPEAQDPEPEVSDEGPGGDDGAERDPEPELADGGDVWDRLLAFQISGGIDTPFGVAGGAIEFTPIRYFAIYAGGGIGRSGGRVAGGIRGQAPVGNAAVSLMLGVHGGPLDWDSRGRTNEEQFTSRYWEFALFWHAGINVEYRWDMGLFARLSFGVEALVTPDAADVCTTGPVDDRMDCGVLGENLSKPVRGWTGLTLGYALDL